METKRKPPLHRFRVEGTRAAINRAHMLVHSLMVLAGLALLQSFIAALLPDHLQLPLPLDDHTHMAAFPERLGNDHRLPAIDVFICTADPTKEPTVDVMNTVVSAMALDYPAEKLWVHLSDDGGAAITLYALRHAFSFAKVWLPFCMKYGVRTRCPKAYFYKEKEDGLIRSAEFLTKGRR